MIDSTQLRKRTIGLMPAKGWFLRGSTDGYLGAVSYTVRSLVISATLPLDVRSVPFSSGHHLASAKLQAIKSRYKNLKTYQKALSTGDPKENHHLP